MQDVILDNQVRTVAQYLRGQLDRSARFLIVSAYFSIYGYELLAKELAKLEDTRFLFGEPSSIDGLDPGHKEVMALQLTEDGLTPVRTTTQKGLARECARWFESDAVAVRTIRRSNFLHGKMYLLDHSGVVGSSNFTRNGLGEGQNPNLEINLAVSVRETLDELQAWFDDIWRDDRLTKDAKQDVLNALDRLHREYSPEFVYFKSLYELLKGRIDSEQDSDRQMEDNHLFDSAIWNALYQFQKDGAKSVIARLKQHNGCILADSVGLGKTYTALAVIKYHELRNERVLVLCPRKLRENWALYPAHLGHRDNPFVGDRFGYTLLSHTDLSRDGGNVGDIDLAKFNWGGYDLIVIDESHNFRNDGGARYDRLLNEIIRDGSKTKVLMLSATPVNTSLLDLRNQIYLMTEKNETHFQNDLRINNVGRVLRDAQRAFKQWEEEQRGRVRTNKGQLLERLGADFLRLLDGVSISRSRRQVTKFYAAEMDRIGHFPAHAKPVNRYPATDLHGELSYKELAKLIRGFELSIYRPSDYLINKERQLELDAERRQLNFNQQDREHYLVKMILTNFLKRLESSPLSLQLTLRRTIAKMDDLLQKMDRFDQLNIETDIDDNFQPDEDEDDDDFLINRARNPYHLRELDLLRWRKDVAKDRETIGAALEIVSDITPERDGKLAGIRQALHHRAANPTTDVDGQSNRKMLVFTTFKDTAEYLYEQLTSDADELGLRIAMVSGDSVRDSLSATDFNAILTDFAPKARSRSETSVGQDVDLLIATDCISEGQNLQDCDTVLNYDIHWNPVRLIQRFGRIDRIGSKSSEVRMINYWPTDDMDAYLNLEGRVMARMALADTAASGSDDPFHEEEVRVGAQLELNFRDEQLKRLREEILDLDDLSDTVVLSDLSMDYFFAQLKQFLERNRDELEATPNGVYAITNDPKDGQGPGVLFLLKQRNAGSTERRRTVSPVHPFFLVFIKKDRTIRFGAGNARQVLEYFDRAAAGIDEPIMALCDQFNFETKQGKDMAQYDDLIIEVLSHIRQAESSAASSSVARGGNRDAVLPRTTETPRDPTDFELVTWLIIK
ncbi:MAG: helicase-related protein [Chloroflexi bacterium]|nr:helicase-related protein [Chloroflexota bacterium]